MRNRRLDGLLYGLLAAVFAVVGVGCIEKAPVREARIGHYAGDPAVLAGLGRVALVPLANEADYPGVEAGMTQELFQAIQARQLFHVDVAPPGPDCTWAESAFWSRTLSLRDLGAMRKTLGADAALVGSVTHFLPYPRMQTGLYLRLIDLRDGRLLWAVDHTWDAETAEVQERLKCYFDRYMGARENPLAWQLALVSPRTFQRFVAHEAALTLPGGPAPAPLLGEMPLLGSF